MKKRLLSLVIALLLCLALLPAAAFAEEERIELAFPPTISEVTVCTQGTSAWVEVKLLTPSEVQNIINTLRSFGITRRYAGFILELSVDGGGWQRAELTVAQRYDDWNGVYRTGTIAGLTAGSGVQARARYYGEDNDGRTIYSEWSEAFSASGSSGGQEPQPTEAPVSGGEAAYTVSDWARSEVDKAAELGLIPAQLLSADLTQPIDRREFAAVSVKVFEALSGAAAWAAGENPFTDTDDPEVLKAVDIGITNGMSADTFEPDTLLNRETASTMLARAFKRAKLEGWTLSQDGSFAEAFHALFDMPETFVDDADISPWARDSVYFMAANGVLKGRDNGGFDPKSYATRQEALLIAVRMVQNLSGIA